MPDSLWPLGHSPPGSSVHGILQARILEWIAISYSRGSSYPGIESGSLASPALADEFFITSTTWEAPLGPSHPKTATKPGESFLDSFTCLLCNLSMWSSQALSPCTLAWHAVYACATPSPRVCGFIFLHSDTKCSCFLVALQGPLFFLLF